MNREFVSRYLEVFRHTHALSASAVAALGVASLDPLAALKPPTLVTELQITYQTALNIVQRLKVEGYLSRAGFLTELGRKAVGLPPL